MGIKEYISSLPPKWQARARSFHTVDELIAFARAENLPLPGGTDGGMTRDGQTVAQPPTSCSFTISQINSMGQELASGNHLEADSQAEAVGGAYSVCCPQCGSAKVEFAEETCAYVNFRCNACGNVFSALSR